MIAVYFVAGRQHVKNASTSRLTYVYRQLKYRTGLELQGRPLQEEVRCSELAMSADTSRRSNE